MNQHPHTELVDVVCASCGTTHRVRSTTAALSVDVERCHRDEATELPGGNGRLGQRRCVRMRPTRLRGDDGEEYGDRRNDDDEATEQTTRRAETACSEQSEDAVVAGS